MSSQRLSFEPNIQIHSMIARPEDKETVARIDYDNTKNTNLKTLYNKVSNDMHLYKDDFAEKVTTRWLKRQLSFKPTVQIFGKHTG